jgi:hypothetical protein
MSSCSAETSKRSGVRFPEGPAAFCYARLCQPTSYPYIVPLVPSCRSQSQYYLESLFHWRLMQVRVLHNILFILSPHRLLHSQPSLPLYLNSTILIFFGISPWVLLCPWCFCYRCSTASAGRLLLVVQGLQVAQLVKNALMPYL